MNATDTRRDRIAQMWADRESAKMRRAIQADQDRPAHVMIADSYLCRCGWGEGKSYRSIAAHVGQMNRKGRRES